MKYAFSIPFLAICLLFFVQNIQTSSANSNITIKSSVSPEFPDGLHAKYLTYISEKLNVPIEIYPMPFARRLASLKDGTINLMVGLKRSHVEDQFEFLYPNYEQLRASYFVRFDSPHLETAKTELNELVAGYSIDEKEMLQWANETFKHVVTVTSLEQKIRLLEKKRIDTFVHFESSARYKIRLLGLESVIIPAVYQPGDTLSYHFAINRQSELYLLKEDIEEIIAIGVENGDFEKIRYEHELAISAEKTK